MAELKLHQELFDYDSEIRRIHPVFCGVDEAGRGPLAGDVYAAAVILSDKTLIKGLNDSKKISEKNREKLFDIIVFLKLFVKVKAGWSDDARALKSLGYDDFER